VAQTDALGTATLLLDCGADPNSSYLWPEPTGPNKYTALTGVFGRGEAGPIAEPPHRDQRALALLLLARGADPNDGQTLYQCHFDDDDTFLEVLFEGGLDVSTIERSMLATAAAKGYAKRVALLLAHGFDPNAEDRGGRSAYHNALLHGHDTIAQALVAAGATTTPLSDPDSLRAACFRGDAETARVLAAAHPELLDDASLLVGAAGDGNLEAVRLLLDLGLAPCAANDHSATALHQAAFGGHTGVVRELLARGAPVDVNESAHGATPASWADHAGHKELAHLIAGHSNNALDVTFHAHFPRLRALLDEDPNALSICDRHGHSALHYVDPNRADAPDLVRFLIAHGAPLDATSEWGETALERFLRMGAEDLADLMIEAGASE
jgi:ankyrin repeat protein